MPHIYLIIRYVSGLVFKCRSEGWSCQLFCLISSHYCWVNPYCPGSKRNSHESAALVCMLLSHLLSSFSCNWMLWKGESMQRWSDNQFKSTQPGQEHKADTQSNCLFLGGNTIASDYRITHVAAFLWFRFTVPGSQTKGDWNESECHPWGQDGRTVTTTTY